MKKTLTTEQRVAKILEGMRKAMPEIKRQVAVYEKSLQHSTGVVGRSNDESISLIHPRIHKYQNILPL